MIEKLTPDVCRILSCSGVLVAAIAVLLNCAPSNKPPEDPYKGFRMGVQSYSLRAFTVQEAIANVKKLGLHFIEIFSGHFPITSSAEAKEALKTMLSVNQISLVAYGVCDFKGDSALARQYFDFAKDMGIEVLAVNPTPEELNFLDHLVQEYDIKVAIHNHGPKARYDKLQDVLKAVAGRDPRIGACIDTGHFMRSDEDPVNCAKSLGARTHLIHLKDIKVEGEKKIFTIQGDGDMDMKAFFTTLKSLKYAGPFSLEYEENEKNPMPDMETCMANVRKALEKVKM